MKKKVLFALIALFSCLTTWAADVVTVGGYDVTLSSKVVALPAAGNATAPVVTSVKTGQSSNLFKASESVYKIDGDGKLVTAELNAVGNYFLKVTTTDSKSLFVPFVVGQEGAQVNPQANTEGYQLGFEYIANKADFMASLENEKGGVYFWAQVGGDSPDSFRWNTAANKFALFSDKVSGEWPGTCPQNWYGAIYAPGCESPKGSWPQVFVYPLTPFMEAYGSRRCVYFQYDGVSYSACGPMNKACQIAIPGVLGMEYAFGREGELMGSNNDADVHWVTGATADDLTTSDVPATTFDVSKLKVFFTPAADYFGSSICLDYYETVYAGSNTRIPRLYEDEIDENNEILYYNTENENVTWFGPDGTALSMASSQDNPFAAVGTYTVVVKLQETGDDPVSYAVAQYVVKPLELTVGAGNLYKGFGDADPTEPSYGTVWSQLGAGDNLEDIHISGLTVVRKTATGDPTSGVVGEVIPYTILEDNPTTGNPNYTLKVTPVDGNIIVTKKFLSEPEFTVTVDDDGLVYNGTDQLPTVTVKRGEATLVEGTDYVVKLAEDGEGVNNDNVNANVDKDGNLISEEKGHIQIIIKANEEGNYTSIVKNDGDETLTPIEKEFDIAQRDLATVTVADIAAVTYNAAEQKPTPEVSFTFGDNQKYVLNYLAADAENPDRVVEFSYSYDNNTYASTPTGDNKYVAECTIEAPYVDVVEGEGQEAVGVRKYTGNFYGKQTKEFIINKFAFVLTAENKTQMFGEEEKALTAVAVEATPDALADVATYTLKRVQGNHVGVYNITFDTPAPALKTDPIVEGEPKSIPTNNYEMTSADGTYTITAAEGVYFVSSKKVNKTYDGTANIPFEGYYLYKRVNNTYELVAEESDLYKLIAGPTANVLSSNGNGDNTGRVAGRDVRQNGWSWSIIPDVTGLGTEEYTLQVRPDEPHNSTTGEGYLQVYPKPVTLVADKKSSEYGKTLATPTVTAYAGALEYNTDGTIKNAVLAEPFVSELRYNAPTVVGVTPESSVGVHEGAIQFDGYYGTGNGRQTIANANRNYAITQVAGDYEITATEDKIEVELTWTKAYGQTDAQAIEAGPAIAVTHPNKTTYTLPTTVSLSFTTPRTGAAAGEEINATGYTVEVVGPETIDGYEVTYSGKLVITEAGNVLITINNQTVDFGTDPVTTFTAPYATVTGLSGVTAESLGLSIELVKPETGFLKNGGALKVKCGNTVLGTTEDVAAIEDLPADWAWVNNYSKVSIKQGKLYVNAADEITLNIVAFQGASYNAEVDDADQIIRDYDGSEVKKVNIICSEQKYPLTANQWYTMSLPFATTARKISAQFGGYAVVDILDTEKGKATKGSDIRFTTWVGEIPANTPFIFKLDEGWSFPQEGTTVSFVPEAAQGEEGDADYKPAKPLVISYPTADVWPADLNGNQFIGTYKALYGIESDAAAANADNKILNDQKNLIISLKGKVQPASNTSYLRPLGAYIQMANGYKAANARIFIEEADGTITVIEGVDAEGAAEGVAEGWWTITGIKLDAEPTTTGTYIFNGKKVFIQK